MPEINPYQAPQAALDLASVKRNLLEVVAWEEPGRQALQAVARHHRGMMLLFTLFLCLGCCSIGNHFFVKSRLLSSWQAIPTALTYFALIHHVYRLAKLLNQSFTPLISLLAMLLLPYALVVPIYYHRRAVHFFAHFGIRLGWWGIRPAKLDAEVAANAEATLAVADSASHDRSSANSGNK